MAAQRERAGSLLASGTFWIGMAFILAAPIMNLGYERLFKARLGGNGSEVMPEFLATLYNVSGQQGVTLILLAIGVTILVFGHLRQRARTWSLRTSYVVPESLRDTSTDEPSSVTASGHMVLQTRKYLT
jgi:hypothetical protein